jgi:hypothetical protein
MKGVSVWIKIIIPKIQKVDQQLFRHIADFYTDCNNGGRKNKKERSKKVKNFPEHKLSMNCYL